MLRLQPVIKMTIDAFAEIRLVLKLVVRLQMKNVQKMEQLEFVNVVLATHAFKMLLPQPVKLPIIYVFVGTLLLQQKVVPLLMKSVLRKEPMGCANVELGTAV